MQIYNFLSFSLWLTAITLFSNITLITTYNTYSSLSSTPLPPTLPTPIPFSLLPTTYTPATHPQPATLIAQILNTLSLYPLAIDGKNFSALSLVFTENIIANYSPPIGVVSGLSNLMAVLQNSLAPVDSQHSYGTQVVIVEGDGEEGTARSLSYYTASQFGRGKHYGEVSSLLCLWRGLIAGM